MSSELAEIITEEGDREVDDELVAALANEHRRRVLRYFQETQTAVTSVDELVESINDPERPSRTRNRLAIRLHHVTLPKLADTGVLEYDSQLHIAEYQPTPRSEWLMSILKTLEEEK